MPRQYQFSPEIDSVSELVSNLVHGQILYARNLKNSDGTPQKFVVTSIKTYKRDHNRVDIGLKRGLCQFTKVHTLAQYNEHLALSYKEVQI